MTRPTRLAVLLAVLALLWLVIATAVAAGYLAGVALAASRPAQLAHLTTVTVSPPPSPDVAGQDEVPDDHPGASATDPEPGRIMLSAVPPRSSARPTPKPRTAKPSAAMTPAMSPHLLVAGVATWFDSPGGVSAAGPVLRAALGPGWRGQTVTVCVGERCVDVVLGDWCACGERPAGPTVIDLHAPDFAALAPLSRGVVPVEVRP